MVARPEQPFDQEVQALRNVLRENDVLRVRRRVSPAEKPA